MKCKQCDKELKEYEGMGKPRKFCSASCKNKWDYRNNPRRRAKMLSASRARYLIIKDSLEYKKRAYEKLKEWIDKNRKRWNELNRESSKRWLAKNRDVWIKEGKCGVCSRVAEIRTEGLLKGQKYRNCKKCRDIKAAWYRKQHPHLLNDKEI
jgi:hypothetical protein